MRGIDRSMTTKAGLRVSAFSSASMPSTASFTTYDVCISSADLTMSRITSLSSTTRTRLFILHLCAGVRGSQLNGRLAYVPGQYRIEGRNIEMSVMDAAAKKGSYRPGSGGRSQRKRAARIFFWLSRDVQTIGGWRSRGSLGGLRNSCEGNDGSDDGTFAGTLQFEFSVNVGNTAPHAGQADSGWRFAAAEVLQRGFGNSFAVIGDGHDDLSRGSDDYDFGTGAAGMAVHIGKAFLQNPEQNEFQFSRQLQIVRSFESDGDFAAFRETVHQPPGGSIETNFVEHGGMQKIGNGAGLSEPFVSECNRAGYSRGIFLRAGIGFCQLAEFHLQGCENLADTVVQVARNLAAFFVLHLQHSAAQAANNLFGVLALAQLKHEFNKIQDRKDQHHHKGNGEDKFLRGVSFIGDDRSLAQQFSFFRSQRLLGRAVCSKSAKFGDLGGKGACCRFKLLQRFRLTGKNIRKTCMLGRVQIGADGFDGCLYPARMRNRIHAVSVARHRASGGDADDQESQ